MNQNKKKLKKGNKKNLSVKSGFSLIEVLVTMLVLSFGLVGVSALMVSSIKSSQDARNQIIASELAQEGIELVKNLKDNNSTAFSSVNPDIPSGSNYRIAINSSFADFQNSNNVPALSKKLVIAGASPTMGATEGFYYHVTSPNIETKFARKVRIVNIADSGSITASVMVTWDGSGIFPAESDCNTARKCTLISAVFQD